jgi:ferritin
MWRTSWILLMCFQKSGASIKEVAWVFPSHKDNSIWNLFKWFHHEAINEEISCLLLF